MNIGTIICLLLCSLFFLFGILFMFLKEKAAILISGFNSLTKEERQKYDQLKMSVDQRNAFLLWSLLFLIGSVLSYLFSQYFAIPTFIIWILLFFKDVHFDDEKAFGKYKKEN